MKTLTFIYNTLKHSSLNKFIVLLTLLLFIYSCKKDNNEVLTVNIYGVTSEKAVIDWSDVFKNESDTEYQIYLLDSLISVINNGKHYVIEDLDANTYYSGKVVAIQSGSDLQLDAGFSFKTKNNKEPHEFTLKLVSLTGSTAKFAWDIPFDPEGDSIKFDILLDELNIANKLSETNYELSDLDPLTNYSIKVIANDGHGNEVVQQMYFKTVNLGSKISYETEIFGEYIREYGIYLPSGIGTEELPLVISLHGAAGIVWPDMVKDYFVTLAEKEQFILLMPQAKEDKQGNIAWRDHYDIDFLEQLIDTVIVEHRVDMKRVYMTGHSSGGFMTYIMAQEIEYRLAAIGPIAGTFSYPKYSSFSLQKPMPLCHIHGTADSTVQVQGNPTHVSFDAVLDIFIPHNNCYDEPIITELPDLYKYDNSTVSKLVYKNKGSSSGDIVYYRINNGNHSVPGTRSWANKDIHAYDVLWDFFSSRKLNDK